MSQSISHDSETPAHNQQVITACAFIHHRFSGVEKVFLPKRADTKKFLPGVFELPGGHIDFGEQVKDGLKREINEEFQMEINIGDPFYIFTYTNRIKGSHSIEVVCFARFISPVKDINLNKYDHSEYKWVGENDIHTIVSSMKNEEDPELQAIRRGFQLLNNGKLNFS